MLIKDIFKDRHKGVLIQKDGSIELKKRVYALDTSDISNCVISTSSSNTEDVYMDIKNKHLLQEGDVVVASIPSSLTSHVGYAKLVPNDYPIVLKKNIIVLRNIIPEYDPMFIAEYLENIGIRQLYESGKVSTEFPVTLSLLEDIDIPKISLEDQKKLVTLFNPINERTILYKRLVENNTEIKKILLERMISNEVHK